MGIREMLETVPISKSLKPDCGVYCIINLLDGMVYIGSSKAIQLRIRSHMKAARLGHQGFFYKEIRRLGIENFDWEILEVCGMEERLEREKFWIMFYNSIYPNGYNFQKDPTFTGGYEFWIPELRKRISDHFSNKPLSQEHCKKISEASNKNAEAGLNSGLLKSQFRNAEHEANWRKTMIGNTFQKGKKQSEETIKKRVAKLIGQKRTPEARKKMSESAKGRVFSEEHLRNMSISHKGKGHPSTPETNAKISAALTGKKLSAEHRATLSAAHAGKPWSEKRRASYLARKGRAD